MSYEPTNWKSGDVVTSAKLNKLEQGVQNAVLFVTADQQTGALSKTWQEIVDAGFALLTIPSDTNTMILWLLGYESSSSSFIVTFMGSGGPVRCVASAADEYPVYSNT